MKTENIRISDLTLPRWNPRKIKDENFQALCESIKTDLEFLRARPVIASDRTGKLVVVAGNMRARAAKSIGMKTVPTIVVTLTEAKEKEWSLKDNLHQGEWDWDLLADFGEDFLRGVGFEDGELDQVFGVDVDEDFDAEKEAAKVLKDGDLRTAAGQLWQLGDHKLIVGDCTDRGVWKKLFGAEKFDFMFTDPPYRIGYGIGNRKQRTKSGFKIQRMRTYPTVGATNKNGQPINSEKSRLKGFGYKQNRVYMGVEMKGGVPEYDEWLSIAHQYQNPNGANVMVFENWRNTVDLWAALEKYWKIANMVIWWLPNRSQGFSAPHKFFSKFDIAPLAGNGVLNRDHEQELEEYLREKGQKLLDTYEVILYARQGRSAWDKKKGSRFARVNDHITWNAESSRSSGQNLVFGSKPPQILTPFVKILSPRNGIVAEPFGGSGSTLVSCEIMKRKCRVIEIVPLYAEIILRRWEKLTSHKAVKIHD